ncbi:uncharacterized protein LOC122308314 [Carya illinoinensis]|uniref:Helicase MAGATAMA 3 n=1 Tax=Carya illinoinensis TaxID=32201 RepID=A0A8T1QRM9_CARIL|nr:uncharacterized protein LOC122308314 [Carya illinoinensis]KAG6656861.1 hypothetical protein CIPAW_04G050300 [Carya illinoinensis]
MEKKVSKKEGLGGKSLLDIVFSWSLEDVINKDLYRNQVKTIPDTFLSVEDYKKSFIYPLLEETHADLFSNMTTLFQAPTREILDVETSEAFKPPEDLFYCITLKKIANAKEAVGKYIPQFGDLIALTDVRPMSIDDLNRPGRLYLLAYVEWATEEDYVQQQNFDDQSLDMIKILASKPIFKELNLEEKKETLFAVYLMNMITNIRIWRALSSGLDGGNIIKEVLQANSADENCTSGFFKGKCSLVPSYLGDAICPYNLNDSQQDAVLSCVDMRNCYHQNTVKLIWGPPGTGKTKTIGFVLFSLLKLKCRTLTCAPTNIAVLEVTKRLLRLVREKQTPENDKYGLGDIVLFGNKKRMKIGKHDDLLDVFLDDRVKTLVNCFLPSTGWKNSLESMISLLDDPESQYNKYLENKKKDDNGDDDKLQEESDSNPSKDDDVPLTFEEYFKQTCESLELCMVNLYTHLPTSLIQLEVAKNMIRALGLLKSLETMLGGAHVANEGLKQVLNDIKDNGSSVGCSTMWSTTRKECLQLLRSLPLTFFPPDIIGVGEYAIKDFCLANACLVFCTASSSCKLNTVDEPLEYLLIDEAAQLKECESAIPLQLPGLRHAILVGDEMQLPALVKSKISEKAKFGRSLFERLVVLGHHRLLLDVQYRMHPSISLFPNREFYFGRIKDAQNVKQRSYEKHFLQGKMYSSYSFISIAHGKEERGDSHSSKNVVEAAVVSEIVSKLFKRFLDTGNRVSIGVISPYKAQVYAIEKQIGEYKKYTDSGFSVSARSVDGFQGGEEDVIIISTVRCNGNGSVGFVSNRQRANVALTRARHCLWILGDEFTLLHSGSVWKKLVLDAKERDCFHRADEDKSLAQAIVASLVELGQFDTLLHSDTLLFREATWKVFFDNAFGRSMARIRNAKICKEVLSMLTKLASGWRPPQVEKAPVALPGRSSQLLEMYKIKGQRCLYLLWTVDIIKEDSNYIQVMKVFDVVPLSDVLKLAKQVDILFRSYTEDKMQRCKYRCVLGNLIVPMRWPVDTSSCAEPVDALCLSRALSLLSLREEPETSTASTYR